MNKKIKLLNFVKLEIYYQKKNSLIKFFNYTIKGESYIIDRKAVNKDNLYRKLDQTTLNWTDGVFTEILRKILDSQRGESNKRYRIIFDGDVDLE